MTSEVIISARVHVRPAALDNNIVSTLLASLQQRKREFNSRETGSVIEILEVLEYNNQVPSSGIVVFQVTFSATAFLPEKGKELDATVFRVISVGIVCCFCGVRIWIHGEEMPGYQWDGQTFCGPSGPVEVGDTMRVQISTIRYEKKVFSCIGSLVLQPQVLQLKE